MGSCTSTPATSTSTTNSNHNANANNSNDDNNAASSPLLERAASVIAELHDTQKLVGPVIRAQVTAAERAVNALDDHYDSDDEDDKKQQAAVLNQAKAQITFQIMQQKDGMVSQQVVTVIVAVAAIAYQNNFEQARLALANYAQKHSRAARMVVQKYWPSAGYAMNAAEQAAVGKSLVFVQEFITTPDVDSRHCISKQAYMAAVEKNIMANRNAPEMVQFLLMGLTAQDFVQAFTQNAEVPAWLTYLDALEQQSIGAGVLQDRITAAAFAAARNMPDDDDESEEWNEKDWSPNGKNMQALAALRTQMTAQQQPAQ